MNMQDRKFSLQVIARWLLIITAIEAGVGLTLDYAHGRPAIAPVAWPQAIGRSMGGMVIFLGLLWLAGLFSDLFGEGE